MSDVIKFNVKLKPEALNRYNSYIFDDKHQKTTDSLFGVVMCNDIDDYVCTSINFICVDYQDGSFITLDITDCILADYEKYKKEPKTIRVKD